MDAGAQILGLLQGALRILEVVLIFGILVAGHEYGHFLVSKLVGIRVDEFGIGFGKRLFSWRRGETLYTINMIPLGGYNKIYGMDLEDPEQARKRKDGKEAESAPGKAAPPDYSLAPPDDPRAFVNRPLLHRFLVILAGPVSNILIAILVIFLMGITMGFPAAEFGGVIPGGPAARAGLMPNDTVTHLDGVRLSSTYDLHRAIAFSNGRAIHLKGMRDHLEFTATVIPQQIRLVDSHFCRLGFVYLNDGTIIHVPDGSPAARSRVERGDIILEVDGLRFPSHRLDVDSGSGIMSLLVYRGYSRLRVDIEYFNNEFNRDFYSPFNYFLDEDRMVTAVVPGGIADKAGLAERDRIVETTTVTWTTGAGEHAEAPTPLTVVYEREGKQRSIRLDPDRSFSRIQVYMDDASLPVLTNLPYGHRLHHAGLRTDDIIVSVGGVTTPNGISAFLEFERQLGEKVSVVALSGGQERVFVVPVPGEGDNRELRAFFGGVHFRTRYFPAGPVASLAAGARKAEEVTQFIFVTIGMLASGQASIRDLAGPVGIATITYQAASSGLADLINIMVLLSVNLAIFNLLPFPALDGGRILFMIPEAILRRPVVTVRIENIIHIAGFLLLILFAIFITYHDIARLVLSN